MREGRGGQRRAEEGREGQEEGRSPPSAHAARPSLAVCVSQGAVTEVAIDRSGTYMATAGRDGALKVRPFASAPLASLRETPGPSPFRRTPESSSP
eukprot:3585558-Prymnesium_polylepis.1